MKVEKNGKNGPVTIILNGNGEAELFWHLFNISESRYGEAYFGHQNTVSAREAWNLLVENGVRYWELFDEVCRPKDYPRH